MGGLRTSTRPKQPFGACLSPIRRGTPHQRLRTRKRAGPPDRLIGASVPGQKPQMARVTGVTLLIAGLLGLSGLAVLSYETYAWTTITVGRAFSYGGIYAPRGSEMPMQIIDWWFGTFCRGKSVARERCPVPFGFFPSE